MRKVIAATFVSLDGVMQAPGGPEEDPTGGFRHGGWTWPYSDETTGEVLRTTLDARFDLLLGRKTYEIFAAYWPFQSGPIGEKFNAVTKYVATSSREPLKWQKSVALHGDVTAEVARLKKEDGPDLLLQGSGELIQALLANDLIDEFRLMIFPITLGPGKRLFGKGTIPAGLRLIESKVSPSGVTMNKYVRAGEVKTGSFAHANPSAEEIARREKMKKEG
jgi:dihydrofolate reductase